MELRKTIFTRMIRESGNAEVGVAREAVAARAEVVELKQDTPEPQRSPSDEIERGVARKAFACQAKLIDFKPSERIPLQQPRAEKKHVLAAREPVDEREPPSSPTTDLIAGRSDARGHRVYTSSPTAPATPKW